MSDATRPVIPLLDVSGSVPRISPGFLPAILTFAFVLLVNVAPLALGSNRAFPWSYNAILAGVLLIAVIAWQILEMKHGAEVSMRPVLLPLFLVMLVLVWIGVQVFGFPDGGLAHPMWQVAGGIDGSITRRSLSINPMSSIDGATRLLTYVSVFLAAYLLAANRDRAMTILWFFVCSACAYAIYGLARYSLDWNKVLWFSAITTRLTGPFVGQNNAATYFGLGLVGALALLLQSFRRAERKSRHSSFSYRLIAAVQTLSGRTGIILVMFSILLVALLLTSSRAGIAATLGGCLALLALQAVKKRGGGHGATRFAGLASVVVLFVLIFELSGGQFAQRLLASELETGGRFEVYRMTFAAISDHAWLGTGYGTFQDVFPLYRDDLLVYGQIWDKAHNDYLELFLGLGLPIALIFLLALFLLFMAVLRGYFRRRRDSIHCSVAIAAFVVVAFHSLVDFSLQLQAVAMAFAMLLGLGVAQSRSSGSPSRS